MSPPTFLRSRSTDANEIQVIHPGEVAPPERAKLAEAAFRGSKLAGC
jgi:hypothetical protein